MFVLGNILDAAKGAVGEKIQAAASTMLSHNIDVLSADPLSRDLQLRMWMDSLELCALQTADAIAGDSTMSVQQKEALFAELKKSPIANYPANPVKETSLSAKIELALYMIAVLDSDTLVKTQAHGTSGFGGGSGRATRTPIDALPSSNAYPRATVPTTGLGYVGGYQSVEINRPGRVVEDRIDYLHNQVTGSRFYAVAGWFGKSDANKMQELGKAEKVLKALSNSMCPLQPLGVRS